jgi:hypothetical protein
MINEKTKESRFVTVLGWVFFGFSLYSAAAVGRGKGDRRKNLFIGCAMRPPGPWCLCAFVAKFSSSPGNGGPSGLAVHKNTKIPTDENVRPTG